MGSATARFFSLSPLLLLTRPSSFSLLRRYAIHRHLFLSPPLNKQQQQQQQQLHSHSLKSHQTHFSNQQSNNNNNNTTSYHFPQWFIQFSYWVSLSGYSNGSFNVTHEFVENLDLDFLTLANGCLAFAHDHPGLLWSLSREDIEVVVENGSPFLFKDGDNTTARMKAFLGTGLNDVLESEKPTTVDLMKFLLSHAHLAVVSSESMPMYSRVESSVRKLFGELAKSNQISAESVTAVQKKYPEVYGHAQRSFGKNVEMKRGDWICQRCSYMNFAKNSECLQCEEVRPKRYLTGEEWECPQCNFFNFGKNVTCLRCDCKKFLANSSQSPSVNPGLAADASPVNGNWGKNLAGTEEKRQSWFTKITQLETLSDMNSSVIDEEFPETKQAREDRFAPSTRNFNTDRNSDGDDLPTLGVDSSINVKISQCLDEVLGEKSSTHITNGGSDVGGSSIGANPSIISSSASPRYGHLSEVKSNEKPLGQMGNGKREKVEKSERWIEEVAELQDVNNLPSAASDEDFPDVMPMRKGENRFVVSKKKDRSLTSPMYKRRIAMEQAGNNDYVPFVPFPPGYFATDKPQDGSDSTHATSSSSGNISTVNQQSGATSSNSGGVGERKADVSPNPVYDASNSFDQTPKSSDSQVTSSSADVYSKTGSKTGANFHGASQSSENQSVRETWRGRSLEGSAVREPDPLDMSEEAKAERWFRRVAQIKDISELSQIPDEDFPSIMPMRKGVNRFVVSKRKTPLERRLTSSQYRKNLPVVSSDPVKDEDSS